MTTYTIHLDYETGDTNGHYDGECEFGEWTNLDAAKESLKRIKEHYEWYKCRRSCWIHEDGKCPPQPEWHKKMTLPKYALESTREMYVELVKDEGTEIMGTYTWCGYFESLYGGKVIVKTREDDGMSFSTR